ncbi:hypothetical protein AB0L65_10540 [Nonomuraea sp. NPDC052116]|uniref:hypothetical protein n=1 Tax=Nonomuraea sp. NPDC052116 TaxID=3155665 RepID=UPI00343D4613
MVLAEKLDKVLVQQFADANRTTEYRARHLEAINAPAAHYLQFPRAVEERG